MTFSVSRWKGISYGRPEFTNRSKNDYIINDRPLQDHDEPSCHEIDLTLPRAARDRGSNRFGDNLLDLCKSFSMRIVNGRLGNDNGVGQYTCYTHNGESTVDYVVTGYCNFSVISDFFIHDFNIYSNHSPISFDFKVNTVQNNANKCNEHIFFKWDPKYKDQFIKDIALTIQNFCEDLNANISHDCSADILVEKFTHYLNKHGNSYFKKSVKARKDGVYCDSTSYAQKEWFNDSCRRKKMLYEDALHIYNLMKNDFTKTEFLKKKKDYKYCC